MIGELLDFGDSGAMPDRFGMGWRAYAGARLRRSDQRQLPAANEARDANERSDARGAVMRSNSPVTIAPALSIKVANVAISTIGSFFGICRGVGNAWRGI